MRFAKSNNDRYDVAVKEIDRQATVNDHISKALEAQELANNGKDPAEFERFVIDEITKGYKHAEAEAKFWSGSTDGSDGAA